MRSVPPAPYPTEAQLGIHAYGTHMRKALRVRAIAVCPLLLPLILAACVPAHSEGETRLTLVAYSTPREVYAKLIDAFQATPAGTGVTFDQSFAGSTEQSLAVRNGLPADIVALSLEPDVTSLVDAGLVMPSWKQTPSRGMVTDSVVALAVRAGNPRGTGPTWSNPVWRS